MTSPLMMQAVKPDNLLPLLQYLNTSSKDNGIPMPGGVYTPSPAAAFC